jgi:hypothetical protein
MPEEGRKSEALRIRWKESRMQLKRQEWKDSGWIKKNDNWELEDI